jgi:hypothetical protein
MNATRRKRTYGTKKSTVTPAAAAIFGATAFAARERSPLADVTEAFGNVNISETDGRDVNSEESEEEVPVIDENKTLKGTNNVTFVLAYESENFATMRNTLVLTMYQMNNNNNLQSANISFLLPAHMKPIDQQFSPSKTGVTFFPSPQPSPRLQKPRLLRSTAFPATEKVQSSK